MIFLIYVCTCTVHVASLSLKMYIHIFSLLFLLWHLHFPGFILSGFILIYHYQRSFPKVCENVFVNGLKKYTRYCSVQRLAVTERKGGGAWGNASEHALWAWIPWWSEFLRIRPFLASCFIEHPSERPRSLPQSIMVGSLRLACCTMHLILSFRPGVISRKEWTWYV